MIKKLLSCFPSKSIHLIIIFIKYNTGNVRNLTWTLLDSMVTSEEKLAETGHGGGVACRCSECQRLKDFYA